MIRVVNLYLMGIFEWYRERELWPLSCPFLFRSSLADVRVGYDDLGERVRCVFMGGRDLEPSRIRPRQIFDLSEDSISAFRFL